jgi:hypothetical protein
MIHDHKLQYRPGGFVNILIDACLQASLFPASLNERVNDGMEGAEHRSFTLAIQCEKGR